MSEPVNETNRELQSLIARGYQHGFVTEIDSDTVPPGLDEDVVRLISRKKGEPAFLTEWRLKALRHFFTMAEPHWAHLKIAPIDYQSISYYSAPRAKKDGPKSLAEVDPKLLETYEKLGVPLHERARLAGVAVDAVFDSVSVATTFKERLAEAGVVVLPVLGRRAQPPASHPSSTSGARCLHGQLLRQRSTRRCSPTVRSCTCPRACAAPMELSTYFRINAINTGQFERTLIIAEAGSHVSYLEGCSAPQRDENQLHAAVVELVALDDAYIKYSTVQKLVPGRCPAGKGRHLQLRYQEGRIAAAGRLHTSPGRRSRPARPSPGNIRVAC